MTDLISRQAAIDAVADLYWMDERLLNFKKEIDATFDKIKALPSAQPEPRPKRGKWITKKDACGIDYQICSNCETEIQWRNRHGVILRVDTQNLPYCPNCGAKMERSEDGET